MQERENFIFEKETLNKKINSMTIENRIRQTDSDKMIH